MNDNKSAQPRGLFITGTGTGVGKTVVTAGLLRYLRRSGVDAVSMKPVQTGADRMGDSLCAPDFEFHCAVSGLLPAPEERALMTPYLYEPACSPHLAAKLAGVALDIGHIVACASTLLNVHYFVLVEGAGGVKVPLNEHDLMQDLMVALGYPVLIVADAGLGTINHTLMTVEVLGSAGLSIAGIVLSASTTDGQAYIRDNNVETLKRFAGVPVWGSVPHSVRLVAGDDEAWNSHFEAELQPAVQQWFAGAVTGFTS